MRFLLSTLVALLVVSSSARAEIETGQLYDPVHEVVAVSGADLVEDAGFFSLNGYCSNAKVAECRARLNVGCRAVVPHRAMAAYELCLQER